MSFLNRFTDALRRGLGWASARAWSRAGAVAAVLATAPRRRALSVARSIAIHLTGATILSVGVALLLWNDFGPGPLDLFVVAITDRTGLPLAVALWLTVGSFLLVAWALGRRPGVGSVVTPLVTGPAIQFFLAMFRQVDAPAGTPVKVVVHVVAVAVVSIGAGAIIASGLGAGVGELLTAAASDRSGRPEPLVRMGFEMSWLTAGALLGGPFGLGTFIVAFTIGPAVARGYRLVDRAIVGASTATRRQVLARI